MQQVTYGQANPQLTYQYQKPFTAYAQQPLAYKEPAAPYQYPQPAYQQVSQNEPHIFP